MIHPSKFSITHLPMLGHKFWRPRTCNLKASRCQRYLRGKKLTAISLPTRAPLLLLLVLALFGLASCGLAASPSPALQSSSAEGDHTAHRRHTRSNSLYEQEEEELTIGQQFHKANFGSDSLPTESHNTHHHHSRSHHQQQAPAVPSLWQARTQKRESELVDPFVFTFEDYLREASGGRSSSGGSASLETANLAADQQQQQESENRITAPLAITKLIDDNDDQQQENDRRARPSLIIEEDEQQQQQISNNNINQDTWRRAETIEGNKAAPRASDDNNQQDAGSQSSSASSAPATNADEENAGEIRLLFSWRALPTNKCSKPCGRGQRLNHLSCVDLKYNVRVENELCERAYEKDNQQLGFSRKPSELSDEPCNEHDCEPAWLEVGEYQSCGSDCPSGEPKLFKRLECAMVTGKGQTIRLEDSRCNASASTAIAAAQPATGSDEPTTSTKTATMANLDEFSIDLNEQIDKERNSILSNEVPLELLSVGNHQQHDDHHQKHNPESAKLPAVSHGRPRSNEPFYEPSEWSECTGAPCGLLGKRTRKLTCRLYLSRSAKFVDLPELSCQSNGARELDREEPCYMDCGPEAGGANQHQMQQPSYSIATQEVASSGNNINNQLTTTNLADSRAVPAQLEDETIYDLEVARHVWRHGAWTKCSAECLGGVHESIVECWDKVAEASVDSRHCDPMGKPEPKRQPCNEIACAPEWRLGPFSECSRPCGSAGVRSRTVACVQRVPSFTTSGAGEHNHHHHHHQLLLVANELCLEQQKLQQTSIASSATHAKNHSLTTAEEEISSPPRSIEPCNRRDCRPEWQVGPWSSGCSRQCGDGLRNRTVICVQEFASQEGPLALEANASHAILSPDLKEAIQMASTTWHPGKAIQVPFSECYREFHSVPQLSEHCRGRNCTELDEITTTSSKTQQRGPDEESYIDSDPGQDYRMLASDGLIHLNAAGSALKRKTIALKIGGRAQVLEGRNVKIRCRIIRRNHHVTTQSHDLVKSSNSRPTISNGAHLHVEWRKDGVRVFAPNTTVAEKQPIASMTSDDETEDNSILSGQEDLINLGQEGDKYSMMASDEPPESRGRSQRFAAQRRSRISGGVHRPQRILSVRSWPIDQAPGAGSFQFVPQVGGRFSLVKENTLRIKKLRLDDSGTYTCSSGPLSESIELTVVSRRAGGRKSHLATAGSGGQQATDLQNNYT